MKKTSLFILAAGALLFTALPVDAQKKVTLQEVQQASQQQTQGAQTVATPNVKVTPVKPAGTAVSATVPANPAATGQVAKPVPPAPPVPLTCTWDITDYDFGKGVVQLKPASATFTITNAGKEPIIITQVQTSCGCTSPKYTKEPIKPGEKGEVVLTYDAKISGPFGKSAQVRLSDGQKYSLTIKGEVQKAE